MNKKENLTLEEVINFLKDFEDKKRAALYNRHEEKELAQFKGIKIADLKKIEKKVKKNYQLSLDLFDTGIYEYMYLAGLISEGEKMSEAELIRWANNSTFSMIADYTIPLACSNNANGLKLALDWIDSSSELVKSAGWSSLSKILTLDNKIIKDDVLKKLIHRVKDNIHEEDNRVRYSMNNFIIATGSYRPNLTKIAKEAAKEIGKVNVYMGQTACKVPDALTYIEKIEKRKKNKQRKD